MLLILLAVHNKTQIHSDLFLGSLTLLPNGPQIYKESIAKIYSLIRIFGGFSWNCFEGKAEASQSFVFANFVALILVRRQRHV